MWCDVLVINVYKTEVNNIEQEVDGHESEPWINKFVCFLIE